MLRRAAFLTLSALLLSGCASTTSVTTVWKNPELKQVQPFKKIVAMVVNTTPGERRAAEDTLASLIVRAPAVPAYTIIPDEHIGNREKIREILAKNGFDGAVVLRVASTQQTTSYVPAYQDPYIRSQGFYGWDYNSAPLYRPAYTTTDVVIRGEVSVFDVTTGKLLWSGTSTTYNPTEIQDLVKQVANGSREELRRQGLLP